MTDTTEDTTEGPSTAPTDRTSDLPLVVPGVFEPHAMLDAVEWVKDWVPPGPGPGGRASLPDPRDLAERRSAGSTAPPIPRPSRPSRAAPPPTPQIAVALGSAAIPDGPAFDEGSKDEVGAAERDDVDALMTDILATDDDPSGERRVTRGDWFAEVFDETYLRLLPGNFYQRTLAQVDFIEKVLRPDPQAEILDLACGYGRHTIELAARGYRMVGVDKALSLLERALHEAQKRSLAIKFVLGDMRELDFKSEFDGVISLHTSFGFFDDEVNAQVLRGVFEALRPGGALLLEQLNRDWALGYCPKRTWWEADGLLVMEDVTFEHRSSRLRIERSVVDETQTPWEQHIGIRLYALHEFCDLLSRVGFEVESVSGDFAHAGAYVGPRNRHLILVARKPAA